MCNAKVVLEMAQQGKLYGDAMKAAWDILNNYQRYGNVPPPELWRSTCSLTAEQTQHMIDIDFWTLLSPDEIDKIAGICKVFTVDEPWKNRARVITWTWTVNQDMGMKVDFELFNQCKVRHLVHQGCVAATVDGKSAFNQFAYAIDVGMYHCVLTPLGWCRINRCAMGARPSCFVSDTALKVLAEPAESQQTTYIDNLLLVPNTENLFEGTDTLKSDIRVIKQRAREADYTFNEDLSDEDSLIKQELEYLGAILNFRDKTVALADKVLNKLQTVWSRKATWNVRDFIVCVCVLVYCTNLLGKEMATYQRILQIWARTEGECFHDPAAMTAEYVPLRPEDDALLTKWFEITIANAPVPVPKEDDISDKHDFMLVTDACVQGWCGILISCKSGQCTIMRGDWPAGMEEYMQHSTVSEPIAVAVSFNTFFEKHTCAKVLHVGDNTPTVHEINRGYSTRFGRFLAEHLHATYPLITLNSEYYPGEVIPSDAGSRGLDCDRKLLDDCAKRFDYNVTEVRQGYPDFGIREVSV